MPEMKKLICLLCCIGFHSYIQGQVTCKDTVGNNVDWFILYKLPRLKNGYEDGTRFFYMDARKKEFALIHADITKPELNPVYETLKPLYTESKVTDYAMYNDQEPSGKNAAQTKAHSKGALGFDRKTGFWMISSVPRFPANTSMEYRFERNQIRYGQIIFCVTVLRSFKNNIEKILKITRPNFYDAENFSKEEGKPQSTFTYMEIPTVEMTKLVALGKSAEFGKDIYSSLIGPVLLKTGKLFVQTWRPNLADTEEVMDINYIHFKHGLSFNASLDHSKWAVMNGQPYTCIGDINRARSQFKRGGLALCLHSEEVAKEFRYLATGMMENVLKKRCLT